MTQKLPVIIGLGEILWDVYPKGTQLGGAPLNFSHHCAQLGAEVEVGAYAFVGPGVTRSVHLRTVDDGKHQVGRRKVGGCGMRGVV